MTDHTIPSDGGETPSAPPHPAVRVLLQDAARGDMYAQAALGDIHRKGSLVPKDDAEAAKWYRLAAAQGDAHAQFQLGVLLISGRGVAQDDAEAVLWFRRAADQGDPLAQFNLGTMYYNGRGVERDHVEACVWINIAASRGIKVAVSTRDLIEQSMGPIDVYDAHKRAREWKPSKPAR
jgi:TPR repeat protein